LDNVSFGVGEGESVALLGPNGAGKTTALRAVVGILKDYGGKIKKGEILFEGRSIKGIPPYELIRKGICLVPQGRRVFSRDYNKRNTYIMSLFMSKEWVKAAYDDIMLLEEIKIINI